MTLSLNSKKCSKAERLLFTSVILLGASLKPSLHSISNLELNLGFNQCWATQDPLVQVLLTEIKSQKTSTFESLLPSWEKRFGSKAVEPLIEIASHSQYSDTHRYIALMSATKIGGPSTVALLKNLLKDRSWMLRSGALKALCVLNVPETADSILPLVHDPALVVRAEAVEAIPVLKPKGASDVLISAIRDHENYHGNKAQWVPQKALLALIRLQAKETIPQLQSLLKDPIHRQDIDFLRQTKRTIATLQNLDHSVR